ERKMKMLCWELMGLLAVKSWRKWCNGAENGCFGKWGKDERSWVKPGSGRSKGLINL
ncbi:hypothetical protein HAX54_007637, partial [Datura stramonium]|nr:hypothetical protein [Datura stramonium]